MAEPIYTYIFYCQLVSPLFPFHRLGQISPKKADRMQVTLIMQRPLHSLCASSKFLEHHLMSSEHGSDTATEHADMF